MRRLFYTDSLELEINLIGYKKQGEAILFFIKADKRVVYAGLVDCYKSSRCDAIRNVLKKENVKRLDFVCWTHPHDDHTRGLEEILNEFCDNKSVFWATDIITKDYELYSENSGKLYKKMNEIHMEGTSEKLVVKYAKDSTIMEKLICTGVDDYCFQIQSFAPDSTLLAEQVVMDKEEKGNLYSIGLIINIGRYYIFLGGDVENKTFKSIQEFSIQFPIDYIKIPHHGSPSASFLVDKMDALSILPPSIATTTVYRKHSIPKKEVLDKYYIWGTNSIYSTGNIENYKKDNLEYGLIRTTFDILEKREYQIETELEANAVEVKKKVT